MPRLAEHTSESLLDASEQIVAELGPRALTVENLSGVTGASVGSIYHRFESRAVLAAELWIRAVERFQAGLIAVLDVPHAGVEAGVEGALHTLRWTRHNMAPARMLLLYRDVDFIGDSLPASLMARANGLNDPLLDALRRYARSLYGSAAQRDVRRVSLAVIDIPYGAVHRYLAGGKPLPSALDELVAEAAEAVLGQRRDR